MPNAPQDYDDYAFTQLIADLLAASAKVQNDKYVAKFES